MSKTNNTFTKLIPTRKQWYKMEITEIFKETETAWDKFPKLAINAIDPFIGKALAAKSKNPALGQAPTNFFYIKLGRQGLIMNRQVWKTSCV